MSSVITYFLSMILVASLQAQNDCPCCTDEHRQFDFWIGDRIVRDSLGNLLGENSILKREKCPAKRKQGGPVP
jgi:hypothetical protein